jgi:serine phosphatase RsbU (regulator of sigma subunit)/anti-sigma regulatory factor (Ser/Thr protein kinase)
MSSEDRVIELYGQLLSTKEHKSNPLKKELRELLEQYVKLNKKLNKIMRLTDRRQESDKKINNALSEYERYNEQQQKNAKEKELNIIKNDLFMKKIATKRNEWILNVHFEPLETLSGDSYSVRKIDEERYLLVIVDGMGKGLSPSITAALSVAFINYLVDKNQGSDFSLKKLIKKYREFIYEKLLEEEIVAISFVYFKLDMQEVEYSLYGMPPIYVQKNSKTYKKNSNNPPMAKFFDSLNIDSFSIKNIKKLIIASDGLTENTTDDGTMYAEKLEKDLENSISLKEFLGRFKRECPTHEDDLNIVMLTKLPRKTLSKKSFTMKSKRDEIQKSTDEIIGFLKENGFSHTFRVEYSTVLTELLINAYEHGSLGISLEEKREAVVEDTYDELLESREKERKGKIKITVLIVEDRDKILITTKIKDNGNGFDTEILENSMFKNRGAAIKESGLGILNSSLIAEEIVYNFKGNEVLFTILEKER